MMFPEERDFAIADSADQIRHVIRAQEKYGVDVIKILATGGVLSKGDSPGAPQFTFEELKAAADTAHMGGRKIAAHAHGTEGIKNAIRAGIDSIEHASLIDDEGIRLAKQHGTYLVMDIYNDDYLLNEAPKYGLPTENLDKERMVGRLQRENFRKAFQAGVKMAFGTDAGVYPHGDNARQFFYMVKYRHDAGAGDPGRDLKRRRPDWPIEGCGHDRSRQVCRHHCRECRSSGRRTCPGACRLRDEGWRGLQGHESCASGSRFSSFMFPVSGFETRNRKRGNCLHRTIRLSGERNVCV